MSTTLQARVELDADVRVRYTQSDVSFTDSWRLGRGLLPAWTMTLANGSAANTALYHYHRAHTITAGSSVTLDLTAAATETLGTLAFAKVKWLFLRLQSPATGIYATVGNAASNVFTWLSSSTATESLFDVLLMTSPIDGITVDSTHKNLKIANPGATSIIVDVSIIGH